MFGRKFFLLNPFYIEKRIIYPIVSLKVFKLNNLFLNIDYEVVALKIEENKNIYFKNVNLSKKEFNVVKNRLTK